MELKSEKVSKVERIAQEEHVYDLELDTTNLEKWGIPVTFRVGKDKKTVLCPHYIVESQSYRS